MIRHALIAPISTVLLVLGSLLAGSALGAQSLRDARTGISMPEFSNPSLPTVSQAKPALPKEHTGKSPFLAGALSAIIPGVGSFYAGNNRHGFVHLLVFVGSVYLIAVNRSTKCTAAEMNDPAIRVGCGDTEAYAALFTFGLWAVNDIWSIFTAVSDANKTRAQKSGHVGGDTAKVNEGKADLVPTVP
jgi:hypothetical protein